MAKNISAVLSLPRVACSVLSGSSRHQYADRLQFKQAIQNEGAWTDRTMRPSDMQNQTARCRNWGPAHITSKESRRRRSEQNRRKQLQLLRSGTAAAWCLGSNADKSRPRPRRHDQRVSISVSQRGIHHKEVQPLAPNSSLLRQTIAQGGKLFDKSVKSSGMQTKMCARKCAQSRPSARTQGGIGKTCIGAPMIFDGRKIQQKTYCRERGSNPSLENGVFVSYRLRATGASE